MSQQQCKTMAYWLFSLCLIIFGMIVLGGVTRLTGSGLSMVNWQPIMGVLPPLNAEQWQQVFALYKTSPEFLKINFSMDLAGFKSIFWYEYLHRLLGRFIGLLFFIPKVWFLLRYPVPNLLKIKLLGLFILGGLQGVLGWYMVKSGLVDNPHVSQYRLVAHLSLALLLYASILWIAMGLVSRGLGSRYNLPLTTKRNVLLLCVLVFVTIVAGGFVAGLKAGYIYNTFPLMGEQLVPPGYMIMQPWWRNLFENAAAAQFNHRVLATVCMLLAVYVAFKGLQSPLEPIMRKAFYGLLVAIGMQYALGLATLLLVMPVPIAAMHQAGAVLLLSACLFVLRLACFKQQNTN